VALIWLRLTTVALTAAPSTVTVAPLAELAPVMTALVALSVGPVLG
jgi:hypothetical protein